MPRLPAVIHRRRSMIKYGGFTARRRSCNNLPKTIYHFHLNTRSPPTLTCTAANMAVPFCAEAIQSCRVVDVSQRHARSTTWMPQNHGLPNEKRGSPGPSDPNMGTEFLSHSRSFGCTPPHVHPPPRDDSSPPTPGGIVTK